MRHIMGIEVGDREREAVKVQEILTKNGCLIKTRLGMHESSNELCSTKGLIILEFLPDKDDEILMMEKDLDELETVLVRKMTF